MLLDELLLLLLLLVLGEEDFVKLVDIDVVVVVVVVVVVMVLLVVLLLLLVVLDFDNGDFRLDDRVDVVVVDDKLCRVDLLSSGFNVLLFDRIFVNFDVLEGVLLLLLLLLLPLNEFGFKEALRLTETDWDLDFITGLVIDDNLAKTSSIVDFTGALVVSSVDVVVLVLVGMVVGVLLFGCCCLFPIDIDTDLDFDDDDDGVLLLVVVELDVGFLILLLLDRGGLSSVVLVLVVVELDVGFLGVNVDIEVLLLNDGEFPVLAPFANGSFVFLTLGFILGLSGTFLVVVFVVVLLVPLLSCELPFPLLDVVVVVVVDVLVGLGLGGVKFCSLIGSSFDFFGEILVVLSSSPPLASACVIAEAFRLTLLLAIARADNVVLRFFISLFGL